MLTTFPHEECIESKARSSTYKSTALSSGRVDVKLRPKSMTTCEKIKTESPTLYNLGFDLHGVHTPIQNENDGVEKREY